MMSHTATLGVSPFQDWTHINIAGLFPSSCFATWYDSRVFHFHLSTLPDVDSLSTHAVVVSQVPPCNHMVLIVL
jgi:hypothetical protein